MTHRDMGGKRINMFPKCWTISAVLLLAMGFVSAQGSGEKGKAVRQAFLVCEAANWQGKAEVSLPEQPDRDARERAHIKLDCPAYLTWWDRTDRPSPFTIWHKGDQVGSQIPSQEWMEYLRFLPTLRADAAAK
jgi:hypothetical protein